MRIGSPRQLGLLSGCLATMGVVLVGLAAFILALSGFDSSMGMGLATAAVVFLLGWLSFLGLQRELARSEPGLATSRGKDLRAYLRFIRSYLPWNLFVGLGALSFIALAADGFGVVGAYFAGVGGLVGAIENPPAMAGNPLRFIMDLSVTLLPASVWVFHWRLGKNP